MALEGMGGQRKKYPQGGAKPFDPNKRGGLNIMYKQPVWTPPSQPAPAYSPPPPVDNGGGYYGGGGGGGYAAAAAPAPAPRISDADWLSQDSQYKSALAALDQKYRDYEVEHNSTRDKGIQDYDTSLLRLGWMKGADGADGTWNQDDRSTAYGNSYQNLMGDFASRGLLQSTLYDQSRTDMLGNFNRQRTDMDTAQTSFLEDLARNLSARKSDTQLSKDQARVEALARRAAQESGIS